MVLTKRSEIGKRRKWENETYEENQNGIGDVGEVIKEITEELVIRNSERSRLGTTGDLERTGAVDFNELQCYTWNESGSLVQSPKSSKERKETRWWYLPREAK